MFIKLSSALFSLCLVAAPAFGHAATLTDPQIAHIAYTAGALDIEAAKQALAKSKNKDVRNFAHEMVADHSEVNKQALALVKQLHVTPEDNDTSRALTKQAAAKRRELAKLTGAAFDKAYVANEVAYHKTVNGALESTLIPSAQNAKLKSLLQTGLKIFQGHEQHAEHLAAALK
jgi:putative membrane protein